MHTYVIRTLGIHAFIRNNNIFLNNSFKIKHIYFVQA